MGRAPPILQRENAKRIKSCTENGHSRNQAALCPTRRLSGKIAQWTGKTGQGSVGLFRPPTLTLQPTPFLKFYFNNVSWKSNTKFSPRFSEGTPQGQSRRMDRPHLGGPRWSSVVTYPTPEMSRQRRKAPYPWTKEEREAKEALMARDMLRILFLPSLSARPPRTTAPAIIPR